MTLKRKLLFSVIAFALCLSAFALIAEIVLRFLPVNEGLKVLPVDAANQVMRFEKNRDFTWSKGGTFAITARKHSNNEGFLNDQNYDPALTTPLLAVIGDSYVEAAQVNNAEAFHGRLAARAKDKSRVYSFGASGAQLPTYLAFADHARATYKPATMVFTIVGNDFDESLWRNRAVPGLHYFDSEATATGPMPMKLLHYEPSLAKNLGRTSALVRYTLLNLDLDWRGIEQRLFGGDAAQDFVGNTSASTDPTRMTDSKRAIDEFLRLLPEKTGLPANRILFVIDGIRPALYAKDALLDAEDSFFSLMREHFMKAAATCGAEVIDLQPVFIAHHAAHGGRFEHNLDAHWNELGHKVVADAIAASATFSAVLGAATP